VIEISELYNLIDKVQDDHISTQMRMYVDIISQKLEEAHDIITIQAAQISKLKSDLESADLLLSDIG